MEIIIKFTPLSYYLFGFGRVEVMAFLIINSVTGEYLKHNNDKNAGWNIRYNYIQSCNKY